MEILVYKRGVPKIQENFTAADLPELLKDLSAVIWVDMESPTDKDEQVLLDVFKFHPLTVEDCRENRHYPKIEEFEDYLYFIVHGVTADTSPDRFNTIELDGFLGPNYVITYHHDMFRSINNCARHPSLASVDRLTCCTRSWTRWSTTIRQCSTTSTNASIVSKTISLRCGDQTTRSSRRSWI